MSLVPPTTYAPSPRATLRAIVYARHRAQWDVWWSRYADNLGFLRKAAHHAMDKGWEDAAVDGLRQVAKRAPMSPKEAITCWLYSTSHPNEVRLRATLLDIVPPQATAYYGVVYGREDLVRHAMAQGATPWAMASTWNTYAQHTPTPYQYGARASVPASQDHRHPGPTMGQRDMVTLDEVKPPTNQKTLAQFSDPEILAWLSQPPPTPALAHKGLMRALHYPVQYDRVHLCLPLAPPEHDRWWSAWVSIWDHYWHAPKDATATAHHLDVLSSMVDHGLRLDVPLKPGSVVTRVHAVERLTGLAKNEATRSVLEQWVLRHHLSKATVGMGSKARRARV